MSLRIKHLLLCLLLVSFFLSPSFDRAQFAGNIQTIGGSYGDYVVKIIHHKNDNRYILGVIGQPGAVNISGYQPEQIDFGSFRKEVTRSFIARYNQDKLHLELAAQETGKVSLLIWDQLGRRVGAFRSQKAWTVLEHSLDLDLLKPGLYLLEARLGKEIFTRKFVKQ
jgi:hypothetical protein